MNPLHLCLCLFALLLGSCQTMVDELAGLSERPTLDCAVLVTGGARTPPVSEPGTGPRARTFLADQEAISADAVASVLRAGTVFRRIETDTDLAHRQQILQQLPRGNAAADDSQLLAYLQAARDQGYDYLLVVEQLQDGPVEAQGINGRWPITLTTWLLFGLGMFIPDHTFESRATLRVTVRDLQTGRVLHDALRPGGPVDLSLVERSNFLGLLASILIPPFWVHDDDENVVEGVRSVTQRRLLVSLASELKSGTTNQRLREGSPATITLLRRDGRLWLEVDAAESLAGVRLWQAEGKVAPLAQSSLQQALLASVHQQGSRLHYAVPCDVPLQAGDVQVLVSTIAGHVVSATFAPGAGR